MSNAFAGTIVEHIPAMLTDLDTVPAENITVTTNSLGGVTTSYLIPAKRLPLVTLLPFLAPQEASLKKTIDSAYARNDNKSAAAAVSAAPTEPVGGPADFAALAPADFPALSEDVPTPETRIAETAPSVTEVTSKVTEAPGDAAALDAPDVGTARTTDTSVADTDTALTAVTDTAVTDTDAAVADTDTKAPARRTNRAPAAVSDSPEPERNTARRSSAQRPSA